MNEMIRTADNKGRIALPGFANATLIIERIDETEYRIRKARVIPEKDLQFHEEAFPLELSAKDAAAFLAALDNPPKPTAAARKAAREFVKEYGSVAHRKAKRRS
jgi:hypothetical protein